MLCGVRMNAHPTRLPGREMCVMGWVEGVVGVARKMDYGAPQMSLGLAMQCASNQPYPCYLV